jgi:ABC-type amino acid transport substrate-binding protein
VGRGGSGEDQACERCRSDEDAVKTATALLAAIVCHGAFVAADEGLELKKPGSIRVLVLTESNPSFWDVDTNSGLEQEMMRGFAVLHHLKVETVVARSLSEWVQWLVEDKADVSAGGLIMTDARKAIVSFTVETFPARHLVVNHAPAPAITTAAVFRDQTVGTVKGSSWTDEAAAAGVPRTRVREYPTPTEVAQALRSGEVSSAIMSLSRAVVERKSDPGIQLGMTIGPITSAALAVRKDRPRLLAALNDYLNNLRKTETWSRLVVKYFGEDTLIVLRRAR